MKLKRLTDASDLIYDKALKLYEISFPYHEQRESPSQVNILNDDEYHFSLIYDEDLLVGLLLYWEQKHFIYVEHFCILPEMRNKQYGKKTLELLSKQGKTIILEIDPPIDEISIRRKGFYERNGFAVNSFAHVHPPYHKECDGHSLVVMTHPAQISEDTFRAFSDYLNNKVMKDVF